LSMGILNSMNHFLIPALTPAFLNLAMIFGAMVIAPRLEKPIVGLAIGVLLGGVIQLFLQVPILIQKGMKYSFTLDLHHKGLRRIGELMLPSTLGLAVAEINSMVDTLLATFLPEGSVSYLYYSNRLIQFPLGLFGIAIGTAILPTMSGQAARGEIESLKETFSFGLRLVMFITIPATVGLIVFRHPIIKLLFERGAFTAEATQATALTLLCYAIGLFAYAGVKVVVPVFYSFQDTKTPVRIAIFSMLVNIGLNIALMGPLLYGGLALASALSSMVNLLFLLSYVRQKMGRIGGRKILVSCSKIFLASVLMGGFAWILMKQSILRASTHTLSHSALLIIILLSVVIYACISFFLKSPEMAFLIDALRKKCQ
jgi:putative peptidoglycan lipid II flippase